MKKAKTFDVRKLVLLALFTGIVILLQFLGAMIRFGPFSISLVLLPIVIGAALIGTYAGGWLGLVFGLIVLISGDAALLLAVDPAATILVVLLKGVLAGLAAGGVYKLLARKNRTVAAIGAGITCPIVNTGIFIIGAYAFFLPTFTGWAEAAGDFADVTAYIFIGMVGANFLVELGLNLVLCAAVVRLVQYGQDKRQG